MDNNKKKYIENGYFITQVLTNTECDKINNFVNNNEKNGYYEKYSKKKFGYKFDEEDLPFKLITTNNLINDFGCEILEEFNFSVIKSFYKSEFMARDIEYHQEFQYNSHHPSRGNWKDYVQIFIALEDHSLENACLKIIPKSHHLGLLPYQDIVNSNLEHKRAVEYNALKKAYQKYGILNCQLKKGEAIFFNHLIIHGSQNNNSPFSRRALVCTLFKKNLLINKKEYELFEKSRILFTIKQLNDKVDELNRKLIS